MGKIVWDVLDAGHDEETCQANNICSVTSLYEVVKLAFLEPNLEVTKLPRTVGCSAYNLVCLSLDSSFYVFKSGGAELLFHLSIKHKIDLIVWLPGGEFVLLADDQGTFHCIHIKSKNILFKKDLEVKNSKDVSQPLFIKGESHLLDDGTSCALMVTCYGQIVRISNINTNLLCEGLKTCDMVFLASLQDQLSFKVYDVLSDNSLIHCADIEFVKHTKLVRIWIGLESKVVCWSSFSLFSREPSTYSLSNVERPVKIVTLQNEGCVAILTYTQELYIICGLTGVILWQSKSLKGSRVIDMFELSSENNVNQLILLVDRGGDSPTWFFHIAKFSDFSSTYELPVNKGTVILQYGEKADSIVFLEPSLEELDIISNLKLKCIIDGIPEMRLSKLLHQRKFPEAEEFCGLFNLDVEEVFKAKAIYLSDLANPWQQKSSMHSDSALSRPFEELILTLDRIKDDEFVTKFCVESTAIDLETTKKLLEYAKKRLALAAKTGLGDNLQALMWKVSENLHSLFTFQMLYPFENIQVWLSFSRSDMLDNCIQQLKKGNLDTAATLWHRHYYKFFESIDGELTVNILDSIPVSLSYEKLCAWLPKNLLRDLVQHCTSSIEIIAHWADIRARELEVLDRSHWPSNGYTFATTIINALESFAADCYGGNSHINDHAPVVDTQWMAHSRSSYFFQLQQTALDLKDLKLLAEKFFVKLEFNSYRQKDKSLVVDALMDWLMTGSEIKPFMDGFLRHFMFSHKMDIDETLCHYIENCLAKSNHHWWLLEAPWEDKVYAIIDVIADAHIKAHCILECLHIAPVPWTEGTQRICDIGKNLKSSFSNEIASQEKMASLKIVLRRYNLHFINYEDERNAEILIRKISRSDGPTVLEDLFEVSSTFVCIKKSDIYFHRLIHLVYSEKIEEAKQLILKLDSLLLTETLTKFISYVMCSMSTRILTKKGQSNQNILLSGVLSLDPLLENIRPQNPLCEDFLSTVRRMFLLQVNFDLYLTLGEIDNKEKCSRLICDYTKKLLVESKKPEENLPQSSRINATSINKTSMMLSKCMTSVMKHTMANSTKTFDPIETRNTLEGEPEKHPLWSKMERIHLLSLLFEIPKQELFVLLASASLEGGYMNDVLQFYSLLVENYKGFGSQTLIENMLHLVCEREDSVSPTSPQPQCKDLIDFIEKVLSATLLSCPAGNEMNLLCGIALWSRIGSLLYENCHIEKIYAKSDGVYGSDDPFACWKFSPIFTDPGPPLDQEPIDEVMKEIYRGYLKIYREDHKSTSGGLLSIVTMFDDDNLSQAVSNLKNHMMARNKDLLYLIVTLAVSSKSLLDPNSNSKMNKSELLQQIASLLLKIISSDTNDLVYGVSLLVLLPVKEFLKVINEIIRKLGYDYVKIGLLASVGCDICKLYQLKDVGQQFEILEKNATWGLKLEPFNIPFMSCFSREKVALMTVLKKLISHPDCSFNILDQFCHEFNFLTSEAYLMYLKALIKGWSPSFVFEPMLGKECIKESLPDFQQKLGSLVSKINNKSEMIEALQEEFYLVNSYLYELLDVISSILLNIKDFDDKVCFLRAKRILDFLKEYKRVNPPTESEIAIWFQFHPEDNSLPPLSNSRLPFHQLFSEDKSTVNKIVDGEINISSIEMWVSVAEPLKYKRDQLYFMAAQNSIHQIFPKIVCKGSVEWQICSQNSNFLHQVYKVISKIKHPELATALSFWIVNAIPCGADKVEAARYCWQLVKDSPSITKENSNKFEWTYKSLAIKQILHLYNLTQNEYMSKIKQPLELIFSLYEHPSLSSRLKFGTEAIPDINGCVSEICTVASIDKSKAQSSLLCKWLPIAESPQDDLDETISNFKLVLDPGATKESQENNDPSLQRVLYLLKCYPQDEAVSYLLNQTLSSSDSLPINTRLKALHCLLAIADPSTIQKQSGKSIKELRYLLQGLTYVSRLQNIGNPTSLPLFERMNKDALVEGLWRSHQHSPEALLLIVDICCDFKITTTSLWSVILAQLKNFVEARRLEVSVLERVLLQIKTLAHLRLLPSLVQAWQSVIWHPFRTACHPVRGISLKQCIHSANLLGQHCPVAIATEELVECCLSLKLPVIALAVAATDVSTYRNLHKIVTQFEIPVIKQNFLDVQANLYLPKAAETVVEEIL